MTGDPGREWERAPECVPLAAGEVHVWRAPVSCSAAQASALRRWLAPDERARADAFAFAEDRDRSVVARASLRQILGRYLDTDGRRLEFDSNPHGKPGLRAAAVDGLQFNVAHSGAWALIAVSPCRAVGVDVERIRPVEDVDRLARRTFSTGEVAVYDGLDRAHKQLGFFACWTRKEAVIKAWGTGLSTPLQAFDVTLDPRAEAELVAVRCDTWAAADWRLEEVRPAAGYVGAVAARGRDWRLRRMHWSQPE